MRLQQTILLILVLFSVATLSCSDNKDNTNPETDKLILQSARIGTKTLASNNETTEVAIDKPIVLSFSLSLDTTSVKNKILLEKNGNTISFQYAFLSENTEISIVPQENLEYNTQYKLKILSGIKSEKGATFPGHEFTFTTIKTTNSVTKAEIDGIDIKNSARIYNVSLTPEIKIYFSGELNEGSVNNENIYLTGTSPRPDLEIELSQDKKGITIHTINPLQHIQKYRINISKDLESVGESTFRGFTKDFTTQLDSTPKFQIISDEELLTLVQRQTFSYFWDFAHPVSGLSRERNTSGDIVTTGGSGFGIMAIIVAVERDFITRSEAVERLAKIVNFLEEADRFHGVWPHWLNGSTGKVYPFSQYDNGGDLVETSFLMQGLLTFRQYLNPGDNAENALITKINGLWNSIEWDWHTKNGEEVLYWHWSPQYNWQINHQIRGYNEALITYILAAASTTHSINASVYHNGWANSNVFTNGNEYYGHVLPLGMAKGGPLFFAHYSFLGLNPTGLKDNYADYWQQNVNHSLINRAYCIDNPLNFAVYSSDCWGLTASDNHKGYSAHSPTNDLGVITPTAAISSMPYTPEYSMDALKHFYYMLGDRLWGDYGFYEAFNVSENWWADSYLAIDQGPVIIMIENHRTGLLWDLFMSAPEVKTGLNNLGFTY